MSSGRRRVLAPQALGADEYLRATWHADKRVVVFSQWSGADCTAAIPVRLEHLGDLAGLLVDALAHEVSASVTTWAPPAPGTCIDSTQISA